MPDDKIDKKITEKAIKHDLLLVKYVPDKIIDKDIVLLAINHEYDTQLKELNWILEDSNRNEYEVKEINGNISLTRTNSKKEEDVVITTNTINLFETSGSITFKIICDKQKPPELGSNLSIGLCKERNKNELVH